MSHDELRRPDSGRTPETGDIPNPGASERSDGGKRRVRDIHRQVTGSTSQKQIEANRKNSGKSTGPKSPRGKALSRFNALKFGLFACERIISGEALSDYETLANHIVIDLNPQSVLECMLVDQIIGDLWRLQRIERTEPVYFEEVRRGLLTRFLRSVSDEAAVHIPDVRGIPFLGIARSAKPRTAPLPGPAKRPSHHAADKSPTVDDAKKSDVLAELARIDRPEMALLEGLTASDREPPFAVLDRIRHSLVRGISRNYARLLELNDVQRTRRLVQQVPKQ